MSKKPCFRGPLDREHGKSVEAMFQSEWQHLYKLYKSLWRWLHRKKSVLVIHKILRLFVNTLTVDRKDYLLNWENLTEPIQIQLSQKQNSFSEFFLGFLKSIFNLKHLPRKGWHSEPMHFRKYLPRTTWLDKYLKSRVSEDS